jgi:hypothetical protein
MNIDIHALALIEACCFVTHLAALLLVVGGGLRLSVNSLS